MTFITSFEPITAAVPLSFVSNINEVNVYKILTNHHIFYLIVTNHSLCNTPFWCAFCFHSRNNMFSVRRISLPYWNLDQSCASVCERRRWYQVVLIKVYGANISGINEDTQCLECPINNGCLCDLFR